MIEIKKIRKELGLTQKKLAEKLNVNLRTVQKWESGETKMSGDAVLGIQELQGEIKGVSISQSNQSGDNIVGSRESELLEIIRKKDEQIDSLLEIIKNK